MSLGKTPDTENPVRSARTLCEPKLGVTSVYRLLAEQGSQLFADETFADLFKEVGRECVPPRVVASVMVLQRIEGASDREALDRFAFDLRWKYAAGVDLDFPSFDPTVLVRMRARLRDSKRPDRIFEAVLDVAKAAGLVGKRRVLDSTALFDAVATQDTVTMIRSAIRAVLRAASHELSSELRARLRRDDDYASAGKPHCDWDDEEARSSLVDALARDGYVLIDALDNRELCEPLGDAAQLLATVLGQDIVPSGDARKRAEHGGVFRIAERVAKDRIISTVDPAARHGHKTSSRKFDGYKGHIAVDPDSEIITATAVTAGNVGDAAPAEVLLQDMLGPPPPQSSAAPSAGAEVYGDASYGTADLVEKLEAHGIEANVKVQPPAARKGMFAQDDFHIDLESETVRCPGRVLVPIRRSKRGAGQASFGEACSACALRGECTESKRGRTIRVHPKHETLDRARKRQRAQSWKQRYRATRPKVERKIAELMRRKHGGRRARVRGKPCVGHDFALLAAAINLKRLAMLGVRLPIRATAP